MQIKRGAKTVLRHNLMAGLVVGANVILVPFFVVALAPAVGTAVGAAVVASILWVLWLLGWWSKVVIGPSVIVDNLVLRHVIPWEQLRDIRADGGLTFELMDSTSVFSLSYGGSLAGAITGWRGMRRVREQMLASRPVSAADAPPQHHERRSRVMIAWWPLAAYLVPLEAIAIVSGLGHHKPSSSLLTKSGQRAGADTALETELGDTDQAARCTVIGNSPHQAAIPSTADQPVGTPYVHASPGLGVDARSCRTWCDRSCPGVQPDVQFLVRVEEACR